MQPNIAAANAANAGNAANTFNTVNVVDVKKRQATLDALCATEHEGCVMCGPANPRGLKLKFRVKPDGAVVAMFPCSDVFQSYPDTLHGGVIAGIFDAAMAHALFSVGEVCFTAELEVKFLAPVAVNCGAVVRGFVKKDAYPLFYVGAELKQDKKIVAYAKAKFMVKG